MPLLKEKLKLILISVLIFVTFTYTYSYTKPYSKSSISTKEYLHSIATQKCPYHNYGLLSLYESKIKQDFNGVGFKVIKNLPEKIKNQLSRSDFQSETVILPVNISSTTNDSLFGFIIQKLLSING